MEAADLETGMNFFAAELHSHLSGITVRVHHLRNNTVIGIIARDNHFDFNFQEMREFKEEIVIKPVSVSNKKKKTCVCIIKMYNSSSFYI